MNLTIKGLRVDVGSGGWGGRADETPVKADGMKPPAISQALNRKSIKAAQEIDPDKKKKLEQEIEEA